MRLVLSMVLGGVFLVQHCLSSPLALAEDLAGDPDAGRKAAGMCRTCHGLEGFAKIPIAPHIGGEPAPYIVHQLTAFRDGVRKHEMMSVVAASLTDQKIADLAAWYSTQPASAELAAGQDPEKAPELCVACHGVEGMSQMDDAPNLAGETVMYIDTQLKAFRSGKRTHEIMSAVAEDLTDVEIRDLAEWYSAIRLTIPKVR